MSQTPSLSSSSTAPLPVAVIGCGRMGRLHARTYSQMPQAHLVGVYDANPQAAAAAAQEYRTQAFTDLPELLAQVKAVTIATPTQFHAQVAEECLARKVACLIEKPLARDVVECQRIVQWGKQAGVPVQVGHIERFNPAIRALVKLGLRPRFLEVSRISPLTFRSLDVGVVLDLMIHDLDIVLNLAGGTVTACEAVGTSVIGGVEDICNARLTFDNGCVANITASRLALRAERRLRLYSTDAYVSVDYAKRSGVIVRRTGNLDAVRDAAAKVRRGEIADLAQLDYSKMLNLEPLATENIDPLTAQATAFLESVQTGSRPIVSAQDGAAAVDVATRIIGTLTTATLDQ